MKLLLAIKGEDGENTTRIYVIMPFYRYNQVRYAFASPTFCRKDESHSN